MTDDESNQRISQWRDRLHEVFDHDGVLGGKFLLETMHLEEAVGSFLLRSTMLVTAGLARE
jgi:hypothetical protein